MPGFHKFGGGEGGGEFGQFSKFLRPRGRGVDELSGPKGDGDLGPRAGGWQIFRYNFKFNQRYTMLDII